MSARLRLVVGAAIFSLVAALLTAVPATAAEAVKETDAEPAVTSLLHRMTLEEKVGQLFVTYAYGDTVDTTNPADVAANRKQHGVANAAELIAKYHLGGMIYFAWSNNVNNPAQIAGLSNGIQRVGLAQRVPVPLLVSTDQEQGLVVRVGPPATQFPGNMALGSGRSIRDAYTAARITGQELRAMGINQNFGPVADVNVNPLNPVIGVRSFSENPTLAAQLTAAQVVGYEPADGVASTAKHFPGHGDTDTDSHTGIPFIKHTREQWQRLDAPPFRAAIAAGIDSIMTAHIVVPSLDPSEDPATLSQPIMTGILRRELGYNGVVITDSLGMAGVRQKYGDERVPVLALKAGVDQLLMPPNLDLAYNAVLKAVRSGELTEQRIDTSVRRVLRLKHHRGLARAPYVDPEKIKDIVGTPSHVAAAKELTDRTPTLVKNDAKALPLAKGPRKVLVTGWGVTTTRLLGEAVTRRGATADVAETGINPSQATVDATVARAGPADTVVVTTNRANVNLGQKALVKALVAAGKQVVVIALREPYDINAFTEAPTFLCTYSSTADAVESVTKVLFGEVSPRGKLPVTVPVAGDPTKALYPYGHGLSYSS